MFSCIIGEGYTNTHETDQLHCIFHRNEDACRYGIGIGVLGFLACVAFFTIDIYFPQISNATDRKYLVMADLGFSGNSSHGGGPGCCWLILMVPSWGALQSPSLTVGITQARELPQTNA